MPGMFRRLAALGAAAEAARRYAQNNPEKVRGIADKAARFADARTKGKYTHQINSAKQKFNEAAGASGPAHPDPRYRRSNQGFQRPGQGDYRPRGQG